MSVVLTIHGACPLPLRYAILRNEGVHVVAHIVVAEVVGRVVDVLLVGLIEAVGPDGASGRLLSGGAAMLCRAQENKTTATVGRLRGRRQYEEQEEDEKYAD